MLPPEIAMTWYVPACCSDCCTCLVESGAIADDDRGDDRGGPGLHAADAHPESRAG